MVKDINPGPLASVSFVRWTNFAILGREVIFAADDGVNGNELWKSDGTAAGTVLVKDLHPGVSHSSPDWFVRLGDRVLFDAYSPSTGSEPWVTDGTPSGTMVLDLVPGSSSVPNEIAVAGGIGYIATSYPGDLWRTDGTQAGTVQLSNRVGLVRNFTPVGDKMYFLAPNGLWISDGTDPGTQLVQALPLGNLNAPTLEYAGGSLWIGFAYVGRTSYLTEIWKSDGTSAGTVRLLQQPGARFLNAHSFTPVGATTLFAYDDGIHGEELWSTDGTPAGTALFMDMEPGSRGSYPDDFAEFAGTVFFAGHSFYDRNPWITDGTISGTKRFMDINPGSDGRAGSFFPVRRDRMYFEAAQSNSTGTELWQSDGTPAGTFQVAELWPGAYSSYPRALTLASGTVLFFADDGVHGVELWKIDPGATAQGMGSPCAAPGVNPTLSATEPVLGLPWSIQGQGFTAGSTLGLFASLEAVPRLVQTCELFVDPLTTVLVHTTAQTQAAWSVAVPVPPVLALVGASVSLQAAQVPSVAPLGMDLSNGLVGTFGQ